METEGVTGSCAVSHVEGQKSWSPQSCPSDHLKVPGSCCEHQGAPTERLWQEKIHFAKVYLKGSFIVVSSLTL